MGLIGNILVGVVNLAFVAIDLLIIIVLLKQIHDRWQPNFLKQIIVAFDPVIGSIVSQTRLWAEKITGKTHSEKTLLMLIVFCMTFFRFVVCGFAE